MLRVPRALPLLSVAVTLGGCVERRIEITSEPSGALVYVNDQQVGRTPTEAAFLFHGVYDVRVELEGYEPLRTEAATDAPFYEYAPLDLVAEALPTRIENVQRWHFVLEPSLERSLPKAVLEAGLLERAGEMRGQLAAIPRPEHLRESEAEAGEAGADGEPATPHSGAVSGSGSGGDTDSQAPAGEPG